MKTYVIFAGLTLLLLAPELSAQDHYQEMIQGKIAECREAVQQEPNNAQAREELAYATASNPIPVPGTIAPTHYDYNAIMRRNISYNDLFHRSIAKDRLAVKNKPNDAKAQEQLGCTLYSSRWRLVGEGLYTTPAAPVVQEEAFSHLRKAVMLRPDEVDWQFTLGFYLYKSAHYQQAIPHLERCLKLLRIKNPNNVQLRKGKKTLTKDQLLFLHDPRADMSLSSLGDAWNKVGKRTEARIVWHNIITLCPSGSYDVKLAQRKLAQFPAVQ